MDLIRSFKHPPTVCISDVPHRLAVHARNSDPSLFTPYDGRLFQATKENAQAAKNGLLTKHLLWVGGVSSQSSLSGCVHPVSHTSEMYSLYDRFHEKNSNVEEDHLRRVTLVPELNGFINSETEEQLHSKFRNTNYFLNMMNATNHIFMKRLLVHFSNCSINEQHMANIKEVLRIQVRNATIGKDALGRFVLRPFDETSQDGKNRNDFYDFQHIFIKCQLKLYNPNHSDDY